jgi:hypothetical protein
MWSPSRHGRQRDTRSGYCAHGLHGRGFRRSGIDIFTEIGVTCKRGGKTVCKFTSTGDPLCHGVGKVPSAEDGEAEEVDVELSNSGPSHLSTAPDDEA